MGTNGTSARFQLVLREPLFKGPCSGVPRVIHLLYIILLVDTGVSLCVMVVMVVVMVVMVVDCKILKSHSVTTQAPQEITNHKSLPPPSHCLTSLLISVIIDLLAAATVRRARGGIQ